MQPVRSSRLLAAGLGAAGLLLSATTVVGPAEAHDTGIHDNCTRAERHNGDLDRDHDKIACEKA